MNEAKLDELAETATRVVAIQEQTIKNIDRLTEDVRDLAHNRCSKESCIAIVERVSKLENKPAPEQLITDIDVRVKSIENTRTWIVKLIVSVVIIAILTLVVHKKGV